MLISYNEDYEKITMGLLSYIPDFKDPERLLEELSLYEDDPNRKIYLWQSEETRNLIAVLGVEEEKDIVLLRHIAIDPSFRKEGLIYVLLDHLVEKIADKKIVGTLETASIISKWQKNKNKEQ